MVVTRSQNKTTGKSLSPLISNVDDSTLVSCTRCHKNDDGLNDFARCDVCTCWYHVSCVDISTEMYSKLKLNSSIVYLCPACKSSSNETSEINELKSDIKELKILVQGSSTLMSDLHASISNLRKDLNNVNVETNEKIEKLSADVNEKIIQVSRDLDEVKLNKLNNVCVASLIPEIKSSLDLDKLEKIVHMDHLSVVNSEKTNEKRERINYNKNLVLDGVPKVTGENIFQVFYQISDFLQVSVGDRDIDSLFRIKNEKNTPSIIVCFHSQHLRDKVFKKYLDKKEVKLSSVGFNNNNNRVFINEHLTPKNADLYRKARNAKSSGFLSRSYTRNGNVFVTKGKNTDVIKINSVEELEAVVKKSGNVCHRASTSGNPVEDEDSEEDSLNNTIVEKT